MQRVVLIDYGSGNLRSAQKALLRAATQSGIDSEIIVSAEPDKVAAASRIVLPGVGAFGACMAGLAGIPQLLPALTHAVKIRRIPFLGICVGMQLLATSGHEFGVHPGLGWIAGKVERLSAPGLKIPHMGWNQLGFSAPHPLLAGIDAGADVYFVHSYVFNPEAEKDVLARTDYGGPLTAMVARDNIAGTQFHPEKSQSIGLRLLANFLSWQP
jgi:glutamine amidotransferase